MARFPSNDGTVSPVNQNDVLLAGVKALIDAGESAGLSLRLLGGLAIRLVCPSSAQAPFDRVCSDADCVVVADPGAVQAFLLAQGWIPEAEFNLYNGDRRLLFTSPEGTKLDVFIKIFSMCHDFDFTRRIPPQGYTVYPADLVLTKLQIHEVNDKDLQDAACVFLDNEVCGAGVASGKTAGDRLQEGINADYIAELCSADWGLEYSLVANLKKTLAWTIRAGLGPLDLATVHDRITGLIARIQEHEKTLSWRSRALLGTRLKWYRDVEEVDR
jgi:hypothetical protein